MAIGLFFGVTFHASIYGALIVSVLIFRINYIAVWHNTVFQTTANDPSIPRFSNMISSHQGLLAYLRHSLRLVSPLWVTYMLIMIPAFHSMADKFVDFYFLRH